MFADKTVGTGWKRVTLDASLKSIALSFEEGHAFLPENAVQELANKNVLNISVE